MKDIEATIQAQIKAGSLLNVPVASGHGNDLLISRQTWDAEKSVLTRVLEGKDAVAPLMGRVPGSLMTDLTAGQRAATRMILETPDRFTVVQGYAGVGKTTQFKAGADTPRRGRDAERRRRRADDRLIPSRHAAAAAQRPDAGFQQHAVPAR